MIIDVIITEIVIAFSDAGVSDWLTSVSIPIFQFDKLLHKVFFEISYPKYDDVRHFFFFFFIGWLWEAG